MKTRPLESLTSPYNNLNGNHLRRRVQLLRKWHEEATTLRAIYAMKNGGFTVIGTVEAVNIRAVHIVGDGCEMLVNFDEVASFEYKDSRDAPAEVAEKTRKHYPTLIEMN